MLADWQPVELHFSEMIHFIFCWHFLILIPLDWMHALQMDVKIVGPPRLLVKYFSLFVNFCLQESLLSSWPKCLQNKQRTLVTAPIATSLLLTSNPNFKIQLLQNFGLLAFPISIWGHCKIRKLCKLWLVDNCFVLRRFLRVGVIAVISRDKFKTVILCNKFNTVFSRNNFVTWHLKLRHFNPEIWKFCQI